jgi:hypothetical protein
VCIMGKNPTVVVGCDEGVFQETNLLKFDLIDFCKMMKNVQ